MSMGSAIRLAETELPKPPSQAILLLQLHVVSHGVELWESPLHAPS